MVVDDAVVGMGVVFVSLNPLIIYLQKKVDCSGMKDRN